MIKNLTHLIGKQKNCIEIKKEDEFVLFIFPKTVFFQ